MVCVIDNSWVAAYFMPDEDAPEVNNFFDNLTLNDSILIPVLIWTEFSNVLKTSIRRKRLNKEKADKVLQAFARYDFTMDTKAGLEHSENVFDIACQYDLTTYDATYLELAIREQAALATLDDELRAAAVKAGVEVK